MVHILVISPTPTHPANAGNRVRIKALLGALERLGLTWHLVFIRREQADEGAMLAQWGAERCEFLDSIEKGRTPSLLRKMRRKAHRFLRLPPPVEPYRVDDWCGEELLETVRPIAERLKPRCVMVEYVFLTRLLEVFGPDVYKVLDTHDVFANRDKMMLAQGRSPEWFFTRPAQEAKGCRRADMVLAIQSHERRYFERAYGVQARCVGHFVEVVPPRVPGSKLPQVMFIGSGNGVNQDAVRFLLDEIWPLIRAKIPGAQLAIYGGISDSLSSSAADGVEVLGQVEDLREAYDQAWVVVAPLRTGTGLKIKSIEALGFGKALVATSRACEGLENSAAYLRADDAPRFAQECVRVLQDSSLRTSLEGAAHEFSLEWNRQQEISFAEVLSAAGIPMPKLDKNFALQGEALA